MGDDATSSVTARFASRGRPGGAFSRFSLTVNGAAREPVMYKFEVAKEVETAEAATTAPASA